MDLKKLNKRVREVIKNILNKKLNNEDLRAYLIGAEGIDGESIRSYFITYCEGIQVVWEELASLYKEEYTNTILDLDLMVAIEEILEEIDFDDMYKDLISEIKNG